MSSPLIRNLIETHQYPELGLDEIDDFLAAHDTVVLFFTENPEHFPESNDVAVILPELIKAFSGRLTPAIVSREAERVLFKRYNFKGWPSLVFLRRGEYLGVITRVQDWHDYLEQIETILNSEPTTPPQPESPVAHVQLTH